MSVELAEKLRIAKSFMHTANLLDPTAGRVVVGGAEHTIENRIETQRFQVKTVCH